MGTPEVVVEDQTLEVEAVILAGGKKARNTLEDILEDSVSEPSNATGEENLFLRERSSIRAQHSMKRLTLRGRNWLLENLLLKFKFRNQFPRHPKQ